MNYINNVHEYCRFAAAREFWQSNLEQGRFDYNKNILEKMGDILVWPIFRNSDSFLKRIREPYMITAITVAAIGLTTVFFYPEQTVNTLNTVVPITSLIDPKTVKFLIFLGSEATIFGIGTRTLGRLCNDELQEAWKNKTVVAIPMGAVIGRA